MSDKRAIEKAEINELLEKLLECRKRVDAIDQELKVIRAFILQMMNRLAGKLFKEASEDDCFEPLD